MLRRLPLLILTLVLIPTAARPATPTTPTATAASPSPTGALPTSPTPPRATTTAAAASPTPSAATGTPVVRATPRPAAAVAPDAAVPAPPALATAAVRPRAFRTPERAAPPAFMAPPPGAESDAATGLEERAAPPAPSRGPARATTAVVVFRATARTALEGFDLRVGYPRTAGTFAAGGQPADCNAGTGALVAANDRGDGELRLLVASAQALPFPLDVFCRFAVAPGAGLDATAFDVRVAEVTSNGKRADPSLLIVNVVVR